MKTMLKSLMSAAAAALALTACSNDAAEESILKNTPKTLTVNAAIDQTRTALAANHIDLQWSEGDEIYLYIGETAAKADVIKHCIGEPLKATYEEGDNVYANYSLDNHYSNGVTSAEIKISDAQSQTEANVFAGENLPMYAKGTIAGGKVDLAFQPVGCVLVFNVYGPTAESVKSIKFNPAAPCCGYKTCDLTAEELDYEPYSKNTTATVTLDTPAAIGTAKPEDTKIGENQIYLVVAQANYAAATITVTTAEGNDYTFKTANGIDCSAHTARVVNLNLAKAPEMAPAIIVPNVDLVSSEEGDFEISGIQFKHIAAAEIAAAEVGVYGDAELTQPLGDEAWLTLAADSDLAAGQLNCHVAANTTTENRTAYIGIECGDIQAVIAVTQVADGGSTNKYYVKVTEDLTDWTGKYLIVYEDGSLAFNGALAKLDAASNYINVEITDNGILSDETTDASQFEIEKIENTNNYAVKSSSGSYIYSTTNKNSLQTGGSASSCPNTISIENSSAKILNNGNTLRYNSASDQKRFRYYKSGQKDIQLYKLQE